MNIKTTISLKYFLAILLLVSLNACDSDSFIFNSNDENVDNTNFVAKESFHFEVDVKNHTQVRLGAINGNVEILGSANATSVTITGERRVGSESTADAEEYLQKLEVRVTETASMVLVETIQPKENHGRNFVVDYKITLPENLELDADNINGNMTIENIRNDVDVDNVNGNIDLKDILGNASANVVNGLIRAKVTMPQNGNIGMGTVNGNIELEIPQNTSADFSANVTNGAIQISNLTLQNEVATTRSLRGTLGNGQGTIKTNTVNGNINTTGF